MPNDENQGDGELAEARKDLLETHLIPLTNQILNLAAELEPAAMRSLDAIHVATALALGEVCEGVVTYDRRMQVAARHAGFRVESPGQTG